MTDRELLELAAKSIGLKLKYNYLGGRDANQPWDPLNSDGDALRLAVQLKFDIEWDFDEVSVNHTAKDDGDDPYAATRRAIVRAAASIGGER